MTAPVALPAKLEALGRRALPFAGVALGVSVLGFLLDRDRLMGSYLFAWLFWLNVALGSMSLAMLHHLTGGAWGLALRRPLEAAARTLPYWAVLFVPIALGAHQLYPWADAEAVAGDEVLRHKAAYLNLPFFLARSVFYFALWSLLAHSLSLWSRRHDQDGDGRFAVRMRALSGGGLVVLGLTVTFSSIDWAMSLTPHWFSTIYGLIFMIGQALSALALTSALVAWLHDQPPYDRAIQPRTFGDFGNLILAFTMLWGYVNLSQFLIVWSGNLAEETPFYLVREQHGWKAVGLLLVVFHFAIPFLFLLSRARKRDPRRLFRLAAVLFAVRLVDLHYLIGPSLRAGGHGHGTHMAASALPGLLDVSLPLGLGGLWLFLWVRNLKQAPLLPMGEPEVREALGERAAEAAR